VANRNPRPQNHPTNSLSYTAEGHGPPVVLLHGLSCHGGYWSRVVPLLEGVRAIALDFGGHGLSAHRSSYPYAAYERDLAERILELADR
jgi:pimeloyl-ACP methyl ester carboxylesterase